MVNTEELDSSPNFLNDVEDFLLSTNIVEIVKANVFSALFDELNTAIDKSIQYRTGIHPSPLFESIASLISTLEKKVNEFDMGNMMEMAEKFAGMTGELTPESIVNAYINSDMHKENLEEIKAAKEKDDNDEPVKSAKKTKSKSGK